jgi:hypothetical protein
MEKHGKAWERQQKKHGQSCPLFRPTCDDELLEGRHSFTTLAAVDGDIPCFVDTRNQG